MTVTKRHWRFFENNPHIETPYLLMDLEVVERQYKRLINAMPFVSVYYAVKCNPAPEIIRTLNGLGARFEAASWPEIERCLEQGAAVRDIHFGNTIKTSASIRRAYAAGIHSFTVDSPMEVEKVARHAPGVKISVRLETDGLGAAFGLDRKFGARVADVADMMRRAADLGLDAQAVSFHVGSQQSDPQAWVRALEDVARLADRLAPYNHALNLVNLGGGFPALTTPVAGQALIRPDFIEAYGDAISTAIRRLLPAGLHYVVEPGRYLTADAGVLSSKVVLVSERGDAEARKRWVYLDVGRFNGLHDAGIVRYPIVTSQDQGGALEPAILAGPTCDSDDILYDESERLLLPDTLDEGDSVLFHGAGAYTGCFSTVGFNGFPALREYYMDSTKDCVAERPPSIETATSGELRH